MPTIVLTTARLPQPPFPRRADIPNLLTYVRIAAIPILAFTTLCMTPSLCMPSSLIFTMAALTDWLDGYLARRWQVTSPLGVFLDPVADKLIVAVALIALSARFPLPAITVPTVVIICREILISALREWMALSGKSATVKVSTLGKFKTATQMVSIAMLLATPFALSPLARIGALLLMVSAVLTVASAAQYVSAAVAALR